MSYQARTGQVILSVEDHGLYGFSGGRFSRLVSEVNELGRVSPNGLGVMVGLRNGVVSQFSPGVGLCRVAHPHRRMRAG